ncbi:hypothetical protein AXG93_4485s1300 [Marchantia polymorpha subsp. ruderalis]|uniref:Uncharacterized protein n=1 Tax=Marchantia polymorpha subsp. ruderalis TaxID=1480154 RepID=A0A176WH63_MARPO|nr:hypothetical protein AXG93_4485s1300 [Marchantia polymorpha subsp. ruderalis]
MLSSEASKLDAEDASCFKQFKIHNLATKLGGIDPALSKVQSYTEILLRREFRKQVILAREIKRSVGHTLLFNNPVIANLKFLLQSSTNWISAVALKIHDLFVLDVFVLSKLLFSGPRGPITDLIVLRLQTRTMASTMRSTFAKVLVAAVAVSSVGVALAHEGHEHAPAPAPLGVSAASGLLPTTVVTSLIVAITGFVAARFL